MALYEQFEIVLVSGGRNTKVIADEFTSRYSQRSDKAHATLFKTLKNFEETGPVCDRGNSERSRIITDENTAMSLVATFEKTSKRNSRRLQTIPAIRSVL